MDKKKVMTILNMKRAKKMYFSLIKFSFRLFTGTLNKLMSFYQHQAIVP
jgi:hypothetical protein